MKYRSWCPELCLHGVGPHPNINTKRVRISWIYNSIVNIWLTLPPSLCINIVYRCPNYVADKTKTDIASSKTKFSYDWGLFKTIPLCLECLSLISSFSINFGWSIDFKLESYSERGIAKNKGSLEVDSSWLVGQIVGRTTTKYNYLGFMNDRPFYIISLRFIVKVTTKGEGGSKITTWFMDDPLCTQENLVWHRKILL